MRVALDWDGTVTEVDTLHMVLERFGDPDVFDRVEEGLRRGTVSYRECMEVEMASVRAPVEEVNAWLAERARMRPGFAELARGHDVLVLSSGFEELIRPLLAREGVDVEVVANRVDPSPAGWRVVWRDASECPECRDVCKRRLLPPDAYVYAGDGYSDRCAALAARRVFARDGLADWLRGQNIRFETFSDLRDIAGALAPGRR
ncbi:MAG: HAD-IB family phosphatase [Actinomycetota bacterium]|nr:HAD-IB family phosphatase [Actinomycetota bacterium]